MSTLPGCDCLNTCGDDPRVGRGEVESCPARRAAQAKLRNTRTVTIDAEGVRFGKDLWLSHEKITGLTAEQLNSKGRNIIARNYMKWLSGETE